MSYQVFNFSQPFVLEAGGKLPALNIGYHTYGNYVQGVTPVVWICHALTANSDAADWWSGLVGIGKLFDPEKHYIVCANVPGSCYGSTGPLSINPESGNPYYHGFPFITVRDMVQAHILLREHLNISQIDVLIGGSLGGQQVLEWCVEEPQRILHAVPIATNAVHSSWGKAFNESQRLAIKADLSFYQEHPDAGAQGLKAARSVALLSYRNYNTYLVTQSDTNDLICGFNACSYQQYQGEKLVKRFNAFSYVTLLNAMDSHNLARNRGSMESVLASLHVPLTIIGFKSDILFPITEQELIQQHAPDAALFTLDSLYGHDGFLIETKQLTNVLNERLPFFNSKKNIPIHQYP